MSDRTSEFFDRYAVDFDSIYGNDNKALQRIANRLLRHAMLVRYQKTIAGCQPVAGRSVIDIGCGPGQYSITLARQGAERLGLDFAPGMLKIAREHAEAHGVGARCSFALGDFLTYPLPEPFDYAIVMGFMDYVNDPGAIVSECSTSCGCARFSASRRPAARSPGSGNGDTATAATSFFTARKRSATCSRRPAPRSRSNRSGTISL